MLSVKGHAGKKTRKWGQEMSYELGDRVNVRTAVSEWSSGTVVGASEKYVLVQMDQLELLSKGPYRFQGRPHRVFEKDDVNFRQ